MSAHEVPVGLVEARVADPFPYYAWLREWSPVHREVTSRGTVVWQVTRYDDVRALLGDDRLGKCPGAGRVSGPEGLQRNLVHCDPPDHTRLRRMVNKAFTPARVAALEPLVEKTARELADRLPERCDLIASFAGPLAFGMIKTVLGVPADLETPGLRRLLIDSLAGGADVTARLHGFLTDLLAAKRERGPVSDTDLLSVLIAAGDLSEEELLGTAYILLLVGHDTTVNLIGNGMVALLDHPGQMARLHEDPALAVEELLRYDAPVRTATYRRAAAPIHLERGTIPAGDVVNLVIASANRDPAHFDRPDDLDLARDPNDHLSLGRGRHFCVGAALARMEARIAFPILLDRLGDARLDVPRAALPWRAAPVMRGLESLPVSASCGRRR
ncbi:cytochrome P450 family protein [Herbidospora sp. RD11066]